MTTADIPDQVAKATELALGLPTESLEELIMVATAHILEPEGEGQECSRQFQFANKLHAHVTACQVSLVKAEGVDLTSEESCAALKHRLTHDYGASTVMANSIMGGLAAAEVIDVPGLLEGGVLPTDVLAMAVNSVKNHLRDDLDSTSSRQVFADVAERLRIRTATCAGEGQQVTRSQARWAVGQALREHPDKVRPEGSKKPRKRSKTVHLGLTLDGEVRDLRCGDLLDGSVLSRVEDGWKLSDETVAMMGTRGVAVRVKAVGEATEETQDVEADKAHPSGSLQKEPPMRLSRHQRRKLRKQMGKNNQPTTKDSTGGGRL